jgi:pilus assembly protein CpaB
MNGKSLVMLVLAVVLGLGAMLMTRRMMTKPAGKEEETQEVLVAARDFKEEEILKPDMVQTVRMVKSVVPPGAFSSFKDIEERWVKTTMLEGDTIIEKKLGPKGSPPGLVANIPKGMRAFAVEVNEQAGVAGFILPGHRVDVVRFEPNERKPLQRGETILQNVLVLAAGQVFTRPEEKSIQSRTVTLAVTPEEVDILVAAKARVPLSLSLRGVNDHDIVQRPQTKPSEDVAEKARWLKFEKDMKAWRLKFEKDVEEQLKVALVKKPAQPQARRRVTYIYRGYEPKEKFERVPREDPPCNSDQPSITDPSQRPERGPRVLGPSEPALGGSALSDSSEEAQPKERIRP